MPVYTLECPHCKKRFDMRVSKFASQGELIADMICPDCAHIGMVTKATESNVQIKGLTTPGRSAW
jgi:uncharacterized protein YlaI